MSSNSSSETLSIRSLSKSGSWYEKDVSKLSRQFDSWLSDAPTHYNVPNIADRSNGSASGSNSQSKNGSNSSSSSVNASGQDEMKSYNNSDDTDTDTHENIRAIICPHAGYSWCGATAAHSYNLINPKPNRIKTVFILGPDHYGISSAHDQERRERKGTSRNGQGKVRCFVSSADFWETPFGRVAVNRDLIEKELLPTEMFELLDETEDSQEHSLELIIPFLTYVLRNESNESKDSKKEEKIGKKKDDEVIDSFSIVPIVVAHCDSKLHGVYGKIFANYLNPKLRDDCFFVISSDFCHWGRHYSYQPMPPKVKNGNGLNKIMLDSDNENDADVDEFDKKIYDEGEIYKYITDMDHTGMKLISSLDYDSFHSYLRRTQNTICGRNPICVLLKAVEAAQEALEKNGVMSGKDATASESEDEDMNVKSVSKMKEKKNKKSVKFGMKFVNYTQSHQVKSKKDSSVSYASGVLYSTQV